MRCDIVKVIGFKIIPHSERKCKLVVHIYHLRLWKIGNRFCNYKDGSWEDCLLMIKELKLEMVVKDSNDNI